jgi:hypothetical protein
MVCSYEFYICLSNFCNPQNRGSNEMEETMPNITPSVLANSIMGKVYDVLTNGDDTVLKSEDCSTFQPWRRKCR